MNAMRKMDVLVGVKAEQSLRDALRVLLDSSQTDLELAPVGKKDWVAGARWKGPLTQGQIDAVCRDVHRRLLALRCEQRIRFEHIRLFVVQEPIPVFRDPEEGESEETGRPVLPAGERETPAVEEPAVQEGPSRCPICGRVVHVYNLHYSTDGRVVGCFMCGGHAGPY
jgi:hypothetical protein